MDKLAVSRAHTHGVTLAVKLRGMYPSDGPSYDIAVGCDVQGTDAQRAAAADSLEGFQTPADIRQVEQWLVTLSAITAGRGSEGVNADIQLEAYSSRLSQYPADVAKAAVLGNSWKWFPSWAELEKVCNAKAAPRRHMIAALRRAAPEAAKAWRAPTVEERQRMAALVAEKFPQASGEWRDAAVNELSKGGLSPAIKKESE